MYEFLKEAAAYFGMLFLFLLLLAADCNGQPSLPTDSYLLIQHESSVPLCQGKLCDIVSRTQLGSGFVVHNTANSSWALTAGHVCSPPSTAVKSAVRAVSQGKVLESVEVVYIFPKVDLCILLIHGAKIPPVSVSLTPPKRGDLSYALTSPFGIYDANLVPQFSGFYSGQTSGTMSPQAPTPPKLDAYTIPSRPGSSGGPIFNANGQLIGMVVMAHPAFENFSLATPWYDLASVVKLIKGDRSGPKQ